MFTFVRFYNRCTNAEAVKTLKDYVGYDGEISSPREKMAATLVCRRFMPPKTQKKKGGGTVYPDNYMEKYEKAYEKLAVWESEGISRTSMDKFQVYYDRFSNRLVYPIRNIKGQIVNIGGRTLDPDFKEKKLRKYTYFSGWGEMDVIYGLFENMQSVLERREIILFEGCKSVLMADTWGVHNTGALLTSHLSKNQMKILAKLGCRVVFALDKDVAVRKDCHIEKLKQYVNVEYIFDSDNLLSPKDSPVDKGNDVWNLLYERRVRWR